MLDVSEAVKQAYLNGNAKTEIYITVLTKGGSVYIYSPRYILAGSVSIVESLCTSDNFDLSRVEKNQLTFTLFNITENISDFQGANILAKQRIYADPNDESAYTEISLGSYTVVTAELDGQYLYKCTCLDRAMLAFDTVIDDFWNNDANLTFPVTIRNLAVRLFDYLGLQYVIPASFTNSTFQIARRTALFDQIKASELLGYIQEVVGGYFKADRNGFIRLKAAVPVSSGLYPHVGLYPHTGLYPRQSNRGFGEVGTIGLGDYNYPQIVSDLDVADYIAQKVTKLQIRSTESDIGIIVGEGTNTYIIQNNPLLYNLTDTQGRPIATNILNAVKDVFYRPFSGKFTTLPYVEVGDIARVTTLNGRTFDSPIFQRTMSGARLAFDNISSPGFEYREQVKDTNRLLIALNNTMHEVVNTVDEFRSTIEETVEIVDGMQDTVETHTTEIRQNANEINLSAKRSGIFNLLVNSDFSNQADRTQGWQWYSSLTGADYIYDQNFVGLPEDYNKIENGDCLRLTFGTSTAGNAYFYQDLNLNRPITETLQVQLSTRLVTWDNSAQFRFWVQAFDSDGSQLTGVTSGYMPLTTTASTWRMAITALKTNLGGATVAKLRVGFYISSVTGTNVVEINHFLATFTVSETALPFYSWTNYASKDVISQINIQPTGVTIQGEKIDIKGITTFSSGSSGTTVIDGGTVNVTNLNASNITSGSMSASKINGGTLTLGGANNVNGELIVKNASNVEIGKWNKDGISITGGTISSPTINSATINASNMYWFKGQTTETKLGSGHQTIDNTTYYGAVIDGGLLAVLSNSQYSAFTVNLGKNYTGKFWVAEAGALMAHGDNSVVSVESNGAGMSALGHMVRTTSSALQVITDGLAGTHSVSWIQINGKYVLGIA